MTKRTEETLISELSELRDRIPLIRAQVSGRKHLEEIKYATELELNHSAAYWVHLAHSGSLDKIESLLNINRSNETFSLLAIARNVFENLVWLRLMNSNINYGLVFYSHLLRGQDEHHTGFIKKIKDEIEIFEVAAQIDAEAVKSAINSIQPEGTQEEMASAFRASLSHQTDMLDEMIRREFSLYAEQATSNGYEFQAHLMQQQAIPAHENQLAIIRKFSAAFSSALPTLLDAKFQGLAVSKWNWFDRAKEVGMEKHYRFIYSYTSRMLHSTPINVITEKSLSNNEKLIFLDYIVLACGDILSLIDKFAHPGMIEAVMINIDEEGHSI